MAKEFKLPNLGENIDKAEVLRVMVAPGDKVEKDQPVIEISSDKATLEVPSDVSGTVKEVLIKQGGSVSEGETVFTLEESGNEELKEESEPETTEVEEEAPAKPEIRVQEYDTEAETTTLEFRVPNLGENIDKAEVLRVMVAPGDKVEKDQPVIEISSDKATLEVPSEVSGTVKEVLIKQGDMIKENDLMFTFEGSKEKSASVSKPEPVKTESTAGQAKTEQKQVAEIKEEKRRQEPKSKDNEPSYKGNKIAPAAPSVRRFAREIGIDINEVPGSGPHKRISLDDVKAYSKELHKKSKQSGGGTFKAPPLPDFSKWGDIENEAMNNIRFKTAQNLSAAWNTIPHVTHFEKVDITDLENLRKKYGKKAEAAGGKLTLTAIITKIIAHALKEFPKFASSIDVEKKEVIYKKYTHIGIAVDTDRGLLVPVIRDADKKSIINISVDLNHIAQKARDKKLTMDDMQGGVFTISNLGGIGGVGFTPIVNYPEVAILGVSKGSFEPVYNPDSKTFEPRLMLPLSLSYDHRIIDGADAARFMSWLKEAMENPLLLVL